MKHPGWSTLAAQITAYAFAFTLLLAPAALADAASERGTVEATSQFGPYFAELVNGGGSSLILSSNGVVTECSGRLGGSNKPGLGCKNIGSIFVTEWRSLRYRGVRQFGRTSARLGLH